jgi:hypothetical protein
MTETILTPDNTESITELYAFLSVDAGGDGDVARGYGGMMMPMIVSSPKLIERMKADAREIALKTGKRIVLAKFSVREDLWST